MSTDAPDAPGTPEHDDERPTGAGDFATDADLKAEQVMLETLRAARPEDCDRAKLNGTSHSDVAGAVKVGEDQGDCRGGVFTLGPSRR